MTLNEIHMRIHLENFQRILKDLDSESVIIITKDSVTFSDAVGSLEVAKELDKLLTAFYKE
jgi:hypothetical protein